MAPVSWTYGEQSKVNPSRDSFHNLRDVIEVFIRLKRGNYGRVGERSSRTIPPNEAKDRTPPTKEG
jgi:hypothetical protein